MPLVVLLCCDVPHRRFSLPLISGRWRRWQVCLRGDPWMRGRGAWAGTAAMRGASFDARLAIPQIYGPGESSCRQTDLRPRGQGLRPTTAIPITSPCAVVPQPETQCIALDSVPIGLFGVSDDIGISQKSFGRRTRRCALTRFRLSEYRLAHQYFHGNHPAMCQRANGKAEPLPSRNRKRLECKPKLGCGDNVAL